MKPIWLEALIDLPPVLDIALKMTAFLALAWAAHFALRRRNPRWRVLLWRAVALGLMALPLLALGLPRIRVPVVPPAEEPPPAMPVTRVAVSYGGYGGPFAAAPTVLPAAEWDYREPPMPFA